MTPARAVTHHEAHDAGLYVICGQHFPEMGRLYREINPEIPRDGCGNPVNLADVYRCTECDALFHRPCAIAHFAKHAAERTCAACGEKIGGAS